MFTQQTHILRFLCFFLICGLLFAGPIQAIERYVSLDGGHDTLGGYTNWVGAATGIQYAIDVCSSGDVVWVSNGAYEVGATVYSGVTNRVFINKTITVRSRNNDSTNTIIKGGANIRPVWMTNLSALIGFTLTNGLLTQTANGCGLLGQSTLATASNCLIVGNSGPSFGGGAAYVKMHNCQIIANTASNGGGAYQSVLYECLINNNLGTNTVGGVNRCFVYDSTISYNSGLEYGGGGYTALAAQGILSNCMIIGNTAKNGGGVNAYPAFNCRFIGNSASAAGGGALGASLYNCTLQSNIAIEGGGAGNGSRLLNCILQDNTATARGGGAYGSLYLTNCLLIANSANQGGGIYAGAATLANLYNCTLSGNSANTSGGGILFGTLWNCISWNNNRVDSGITAYYSCGSNYTGAGTTTNNPLFISSTNLRLQATSPCLNTGTNQDWMMNAVDLENMPRLDRFSRKVDMGCYEYLPRGVIYSIR